MNASRVLPAGAFLVLLWTGVVSAQVPTAPSSVSMGKADHTAERERIRREREAIDEKLQRTQVTCYQRFAVEGCLRAARRQARTDHAVLRQQESLMDDRERRERAAQRLQSIEDRRSARAADAPEPPVISRPPHSPRPLSSARRPASPPAAAGANQEQRRQALQMRAAEERQRRMEKQQAAQERKARVQQRQAQEAARGRQPAAPLTP